MKKTKVTMRDSVRVPSQIIEFSEFGEFDWEFPIQLQAFEETICLQQEDRSINIPVGAVENLFTAIKKFKSENYKEK